MQLTCIIKSIQKSGLRGLRFPGPLDPPEHLEIGLGDASFFTEEEKTRLFRMQKVWNPSEFRVAYSLIRNATFPF